MTEPDEAMKFAEAMMRSYNHPSDVVIPPTAPLRIDGRRLTGIEAHNVTQAFAHAYRAGQAASAERIKALEEALAKANRPTHFWASTDGESGEICPDIESSIEPAIYDAPHGRHIVEVETWRRCPTIWAVVHLLTDEEQEALGVDTDWTITKCATEAEAEALLKEADQ